MQSNKLKISILFAAACTALALVDDTTEVPVTTEATQVEGLDETSNEYLSDKFLEKAYRYIRNATAFKRQTKQELKVLLRDLEMWETPEHFARNFPYYLAGYDYASQPVWVTEIGKYNFRAEVEKGPENVEVGIKCIFQGAHRIIKSMYDRDTPEKEIRHTLFIVDFDGFDLQQYSHPETLTTVLRVVREYKEVIGELVGKSFLINVSPLARAGIEIVRPILGRVMDRVEVYDTSKEKWSLRLQEMIPLSIIPPWYGGSKTFKPIQIYG